MNVIVARSVCQGVLFRGPSFLPTSSEKRRDGQLVSSLHFSPLEVGTVSYYIIAVEEISTY